MKDFEESKGKPVINPQREYLENQTYALQQQLTDDAYNFVDSNKLLVKFTSDCFTSSVVPNFSFFETLGISIDRLDQKESTAFVLMPFNKQYLPIYMAIREACNQEGVTCTRSDDTIEPGNILKQIVEKLMNSQFIFAVLDGRNPNVYYEIGLAHAMGKPVFMLARQSQKDKLPFDVISSRLILYRDNKQLEDLIKRVIEQSRNND